MEIVYRAVVVWVFLWFLTRAVGRSTLGELSTFDLMLYVTMGDLIQQAITQQDATVTGAVLAVGTFALLTVAVSYVNWRWPKARGAVHGIPVIVVSDGEPSIQAMKDERLSLDDLMAAARERGIARFDEIRLAVLEADGGVSFFTKAAGDPRDGAAQGHAAG